MRSVIVSDSHVGCSSTRRPQATKTGSRFACAMLVVISTNGVAGLALKCLLDNQSGRQFDQFVLRRSCAKPSARSMPSALHACAAKPVSAPLPERDPLSFLQLPLAQPHPRAAAVFVYEFDAGSI